MSNRLIHALLEPGVYGYPVETCQLIETHISWVILAGEYAYKIKKPVNLGFLDFSTLEKRHFYCNEELRLNRRLAPDLYLDVIAIRGTPDQPCLSGEGPIIEYMVRMNRFSQQAQLDRMLESGALHDAHIDAVAAMVANFHQQTDCADKASDFGSAAHVFAPIDENFIQIRERVKDKHFLAQLDAIEEWCRHSYKVLQPVLEARKRKGFIRECHGDMHLRNLAWINDKPVAFDCIEFNPELRWIDVISEVAFLVMDLQEKQQAKLSRRYLNAYLQVTGDYSGLHMLPLYLVYRALVRAKVDAIRLGQADINQQERAEAEADFSRYLTLANDYSQPKTPILIITHGMSASGKSTVSQQLLEMIGAIRLRSDVERKRLFGLASDSDPGDAVGEGIYSGKATQRTYAVLAELAAGIIKAGHSVIVDATFLKAAQREQFRSLAGANQVPFVILSFSALPETLRRRIFEREHGVSDANLAVLENQLKHWQPLAADETDCVIDVDTDSPVEVSKLAEKIYEYVN